MALFPSMRHCPRIHATRRIPYPFRRPAIHPTTLLRTGRPTCLFRDGVDNVFPNIDGDEATSRLIEGSQFNFGLEDLTDNKPAYINFTLDTLLKGYPTLLNKDGVVIEILETVQPGKRLLAIVKDLKEKGYTLALDDYAHQPVWRHFYPFIDIIKVLSLRSYSPSIFFELSCLSPSQRQLK